MESILIEERKKIIISGATKMITCTNTQAIVRIAAILSTVTDLLAGIPSIIYGLWGFYTLRPLIMALNISPQGSGVLTASLVLAIMIVPYAASLSAEFIKMVPNDLKEGAYSLGATRAEVIRKVVFPVAGSGIFSSYT